MSSSERKICSSYKDSEANGMPGRLRGWCDGIGLRFHYFRTVASSDESALSMKRKAGAELGYWLLYEELTEGGERASSSH